MNSGEIETLVQRYADGIATADEVEQLQAGLQNDAEARQAFREYMELDAALARQADAFALCASVTEKPSSPSILFIRFTRRTVAVAAAVAAVVTLFMGSWLGGNNPQIWANVSDLGLGVNIIRDGQARLAKLGDQVSRDELIAVPVDSHAQVVVAGLGVVSLGPNARLQYGGAPRLVELSAGFVSIKAAKQVPGKPWRIRTPQAEFAVLGTEFNIAATGGRTALRVSEGLVQLKSLVGGQEESVSGGHRAIIVEGEAPDIATSRPGSVLLLTSREPPNAHWDRFNQILIDKLVGARMWSLGFRVEVIHYEDVQPSDLRDRALVIVSIFEYGIGEPAIERIALAKADVPVICLEPVAYPGLGMTTELEGVGFGFKRGGPSPVEFSDASHPLSGGYAGSQDGLFRQTIGWGRPENEAERIAHISGRVDQAVVFGYDTGREMVTFSAPARRVGLFLHPTGISEEASIGWNVFEAAVDWCVTTGEMQ